MTFEATSIGAEEYKFENFKKNPGGVALKESES